MFCDYPVLIQQRSGGVKTLQNLQRSRQSWVFWFSHYLLTKFSYLQVIEREPYFRRYQDEWPIGEFIRTHLKHLRAYQRRLEKQSQKHDDEVGKDNGEDGESEGNSK